MLRMAHFLKNQLIMQSDHTGCKWLYRDGIEWKSERASLQNQFSEETNFVPTASPTLKMQKNILTLFFVLSLASNSQAGKQS